MSGRGRARDARVGCGVQPVCDGEPMRGRGARGEGGEGVVRCAGGGDEGSGLRVLAGPTSAVTPRCRRVGARRSCKAVGVTAVSRRAGVGAGGGAGEGSAARLTCAAKFVPPTGDESDWRPPSVRARWPPAVPAVGERGYSVRRQGGEESARQVGLRVLTGHGARRRGGAQGGAGRALAWAERGSPHGSRTARRGPNFEAADRGVAWALARAWAEKQLDLGGGAPS